LRKFDRGGTNFYLVAKTRPASGGRSRAFTRTKLT
jgi:hypothetical protein